jgi:TetR/AcrR family transcriptional regulator
MKDRKSLSKGNYSSLRKRFTAEERRSQLLRIAKELFSKLGFGNTTTKAIAAAAGVSEGVIFKHFASKQEIYARILDNKAREIGIDSWGTELYRLARCEDDKALVLSVVKHVLEADRQDPQFQKLMLQAALGGNPLHKITAQRLRPLHRFLCNYIKKRQKKGAFLKFDPGLAAYAIVGIPSYFGLAKILFGVDDLKHLEDRMALDFTQLILKGLQARDSYSRRKGNNKQISQKE